MAARLSRGSTNLLRPQGDSPLARGVPDALLRQPVQAVRTAERAEGELRRHDESTRRLADALRCPPRRLVGGEVDAYYDRLHASTVTAYAGVLETLAALRARDLRTVIFTVASSRAARMLLASASIEYDILIGGDHVAWPKPAPDGILAAASRLGVDVADIVYIGDAPTDLRTARSAGARGAAATWGHLYRAEEPADARLAAPMDALALLET